MYTLFYFIKTSCDLYDMYNVSCVVLENIILLLSFISTGYVIVFWSVYVCIIMYMHARSPENY